jgi:hypothetical protein
MLDFPEPPFCVTRAMIFMGTAYAKAYKRASVFMLICYCIPQEQAVLADMQKKFGVGSKPEPSPANLQETGGLLRLDGFRPIFKNPTA